MNAAASTHTQDLADFVAGLRYEDLTPSLVNSTKTMLLDTLGCIIAARATEMGGIVERLAALFAPGASRGALSVAYGMGRLGNAIDFEEGVPAGTHFGCGAVGAMLASSAERAVAGTEAIAALAAGYETGGRIGDAIGPYFQTSQGAAHAFAPVWGAMTPVVFAAAATAARMLGHDTAAVAQSFGLAGCNAPIPIGAKWAQETDPPNTKYGDTGWCTLAGVFGAMSASRGSTGIATLLDGSTGLYPMVAAQNPHPEIVAADLGSRWRIDQVLYKKWPCCRWIHYPLTALTQVINDNGLSAAQVDGVTIRVGFAATSERFVTRRPKSFAAYQFSIPHAVAMVLLGIPPGPAWLDGGLAQHPAVQAQRNKVTVLEHERKWEFADFRFAPRGVVRRLPAAVEVATRSATHQAETEFAFGDAYSAEMCWGTGDVIAKFKHLVQEPAADDIIDMIWRLEDLDDLRPLHDLVDRAVAVVPDAAHLSRLLATAGPVDV